MIHPEEAVECRLIIIDTVLKALKDRLALIDRLEWEDLVDLRMLITIKQVCTIYTYVVCKCITGIP